MKSVIFGLSIFLIGQPDVFALETLPAHVDRTVLIFKAESLIKHRLPARTAMPNKPAVSATQLELACIGVNATHADLLVYQSHDQKCFRLSDLPAAKVTTLLGARGIHPLSTERMNLDQHLEADSVIIMKPQMDAAFTPLSCSCPGNGNASPKATVDSGIGQQVISGTAISSIIFSATDSDSGTLTESFSYTRDGGARVNGLPGGLSSHCTSGSGSLTCTITGTAPATSGNYRIFMSASDGNSSGSTSATLEVNSEPLPDPIFSDGFENH